MLSWKETLVLLLMVLSMVLMTVAAAVRSVVIGVAALVIGVIDVVLARGWFAGDREADRCSHNAR